MTAAADLLRLTPDGLHCPSGGFHIDPWPRRQRVPLAVVTHGHADHAHPGAGAYVATPDTAAVLRHRLPKGSLVLELPEGQVLRCGDVAVSLHPAGHVLGSAQVRVEHRGATWVVTGDFKRDPDPTCAPFEVVPCDVLVTEATFALPIYRWRPGAEVAAEVLTWWRDNAAKGRASVLCCYAFGKAQRLLAELARLPQAELPEPHAWLHGAMLALTALYRERGVAMLPTCAVADADGGDFSRSLVLAPPSAAGSPWMRRFGRHATGFASGWMRVRGNRRRRGYDRGFILSDHADWPGLVRTVADSGATRVLATHGRTDVLVRWLCEQGIDAAPLETAWGEGGDDG